jgi:hypothetical protein
MAGTVIVAHDTTEFRFSGERGDLGRLTTTDHGFLGHFALALDCERRALGVLGVRPFFRKHGTRRRKHSERQPFEQRESRRWLDLVRDVEERLDGRARAIHVMDREADIYELLAAMVQGGSRFVVRMQFDRETQAGQSVRSEISECPIRLRRTIQLAKRPLAQQPKKRRRHPPREARPAQLAAQAKRVTIRRAKHVSREFPEAITVNLVRVFEPNAPDGCDAIEWMLLTTERIDSRSAIADVIDAYCARWWIEEYFKAIKTGCAFEKRQLENRNAVLNALALFAPIAWRLLLLRSLSRAETEHPATAVLTALQIRILERHERTQLKHGATVKDAMFAIAALGGHIKNNGPPGWQVLGRGFEDLLLMERGASLLKM